MSSPTRNRRQTRKQQRPKGTLALLLALVVALLGGIAASTVWGNPEGQWTPKLGLDLEGGRQIVLEPVVGESAEISAPQVQQAVNIIRQRVDGSGVAEAEVTTLGERNIVVSIPGEPSEEMLSSLARSSQLSFRAVIQSQPNQPPQITLPQPPTPAPAAPSPSATPSAGANPSASPTSRAASVAPNTSAPATSTPRPSAPASSPTPSATGANGAYPQAFPAADETSTPSPSAPSSAPASSAPATTPASPRASTPAPSTPAPSPSPSRPAGPSSPSDTQWAQRPVSQAWVSAGVVERGATYAELLAAYDCSNQEHRQLAAVADPKQPVVMCDQEGTTKFLMGPTEVNGSMVSDATSGPETNQQGVQTGGTQINLTFDEQGKTAFGNMTRRLAGFQNGTPQNQSAIIVDGQVLEALGTTEAITTGEARITGQFTAESGKTLADQLKFGALPFSFEELTNDQISPQLGRDQLTKGLIAGAIGLALVVVYSLFQYRALGLVTVASLAIAGLLTYLAVTLLGYAANFRLTMAGVTGLIVAIGVTADSFIVYFERVRDEVRSGRPLRAAVETGWGRARRTIIISDVVNFMAATILYLLSESNVKAFAFTLGLSTVIDLIVVMLFTHPMLTLLARTKFFGQGHRLSGLDPDRLGARGVTYAGRGRVTIADRRAAQEGTV